ncbi:MAG: DUF2917 domain-containing protein [Rubrivivax sp.]
MNPLSNLSAIDLPSHRTHRLQGPAHLRVTRGLVLVTIDGRRDDILLPAGEGMRFARGEAVVAYALGGAASFEVKACSPPRRRGRSGLGRQGGGAVARRAALRAPRLIGVLSCR